MADDEKEVPSYGPKFGTHLHYDKSADGESRQVPEPNPITFKEQRRLYPKFWLIVSCLCLVAFLFALLCFYVAPSKRTVRLETYIIYRESYVGAPEEYKMLEENIITSYEMALDGINYDRVALHKYTPPKTPLRSDALGLLAVVDVFVTISKPPVYAHQEARERTEQIYSALNDGLQSTVLGSLGIVAFWIKSPNPPKVKLVCPEPLTVSTDVAKRFATLDLPNDAMPEVQEINGETPHIYRLLGQYQPVTEFPLGTIEVFYRAIYAAIDNGQEANPECSFDVTVQDTENPVLTCPTDVTYNGSQASWDEPIVHDNVSDKSKITVQSSHESGSSFNNGDTLVTYYATDEAGNTASCGIKITIS